MLIFFIIGVKLNLNTRQFHKISHSSGLGNFSKYSYVFKLLLRAHLMYVCLFTIFRTCVRLDERCSYVSIVYITLLGKCCGMVNSVLRLFILEIVELVALDEYEYEYVKNPMFFGTDQRRRIFFLLLKY